MNEVSDVEKLAKTFASCGEPPTKTLQEQYEQLNRSARSGAKQLSNRCELLNQAWAELLPTLNEMQALLSQRGSDRESQSAAVLPTWTEWLRTFLKETGLAVTMRTVQGHLAKLRHLGTRGAKPSEAPPKLSSRDQRRLLAGAQCANEVIAALEAGTEYRPAMEDYKRIAMGPEKIEQLLETIPAESIPPISPPILPPSQSTENAIALVAPVTLEPVTALPPQVPLPKAGGWSGLFDYVNATCGDGLEAALAGQDPGQMATCLQHFAEKLTARYCIHDRRFGQIKIKIEYVSEVILSSKQAA